MPGHSHINFAATFQLLSTEIERRPSVKYEASLVAKGSTPVFHKGYSFSYKMKVVIESELVRLQFREMMIVYFTRILNPLLSVSYYCS